ncbi:TPA: RHS repeat protein, partial [Pseudomonas aeruginosa]|nr:RHS repeat protein [Pseudomonas aeruginosa]
LVGQIAYLPFGPLQRLTWGNGIALSREYDQDYQLLRQKVGPWQSDYQHDANGNIQQHRHSLWGTLDYQYDPLDRLTEERGVQGGRSYAYDAVGNRTQRSDNPASGGTASSQDYQYAPDSNRLTAIGAQAVTSDAAGNLTQDRAARKLAYDAQGRLQSVRKLNNPEMTFLNSGESMLQATPYWEHGFTPNHNYTYSDNNPTAKSDKHGLSPNPTDNLIYTPDTNCTCTLECKKKFTGNGKSFLVGALCSKATTPFFGGVVCNSTIVMICGASCSQECNRAPSCEKEGSGNE